MTIDHTRSQDADRAADMELTIAQRPKQEPTETRDTFGARVLLFILRTDITGPFTDVELECALAAGILAHCNVDQLQASRDRLVEVRRLIVAMLHARRQDVARAVPVPITADRTRTDGTMPVRPVDAPKPNAPIDSEADHRARLIQQLREAF